MSNVSELIRSANPVPETNPLSDDEVNAVLTLTLTRSGDMDVKEIVTPVEPDKSRWSGWLVAAASFGVVILVAGLALLLTRSTTEELPPASTPTTAAVNQTTVAPETEPDAAPAPTTPPVPSELMNVVLAYESAVNDGDEDAFRALFAPGAVRVPADESVYQLNADVDGLVEEMLYYNARGSTLMVENCSTVADDLSCVFEYSGPFETAMLQTSIASRMRLVIADGLIAAISAQCGPCMFNTSAPEDILVWTNAIDEADSAIMDGPAPFYTRTEDAGALWLKYATLWRASDGSPEFAAALRMVAAYESAFNDGDADRLREALSPAFQHGFPEQGNIANDLDTWVTQEVRNHMQETRLSVSECTSRSSGARCVFGYDGPVERALFRSPMNFVWNVDIADGSILRFEGDCSNCGPAFDNPNDKVIAWVRSFAPEDADLMGILITGYRPNDEAPLLWLKYAPLWDEAGRP